MLLQNVTWEGDNNVLCLQTARYLLKQMLAAQQGTVIPGSAAYLGSLKQELESRWGWGSEGPRGEGVAGFRNYRKRNEKGKFLVQGEKWVCGGKAGGGGVVVVVRWLWGKGVWRAGWEGGVSGDVQEDQVGRGREGLFSCLPM
jgi:hypothetical protein